MQYEYIDSEELLHNYCERITGAEYLAIDTEFVRTRTLYPQLGLIQVFDGEHLALIDPVRIEDLSRFAAILTDPTVVKVMHSCSEDLEAFWHHLGSMPAPVYDTQIALGLLGDGNAVGYARMVELFTGIELDKGESRTDWLARPLSPEQCAYAANDVLYLHQIYPQIRARTETSERSEWLVQDTALIGSKKSLRLPKEYAYLTVKNAWQLGGKSLALLQALAAWRLGIAQSKNVALNFVLKEQNMLAIAQRHPASRKALYGIQGLSPQEIRKYGKDIVDIVLEIQDLPPEQYPAKIPRLIDYPAYKGMSKQIRQICEAKASELEIPVEYLGSKKQINQLLKWVWFNPDETRMCGVKPDLLRGWRGELLQQKLETVIGQPLD